MNNFIVIKYICDFSIIFYLILSFIVILKWKLPTIQALSQPRQAGKEMV